MVTPHLGAGSYALRTRPPLTHAVFLSMIKTRNVGPFDLHVLGMPPAFILSQDQTLHQADTHNSIWENILLVL